MVEIKHKRVECIGCAACTEIAPQYWVLDEDGLATLLTKEREWHAFHIGDGFEDDRELLKETEHACPVNIIKVL